MEVIFKILHNGALIVPALSFITAQLFKVLVESIKSKRFAHDRFIGSGGMPSSHASFIASLSTCVGLMKGFDSSDFAITFAIAVVVMYDAAGVRRAAGTHAKIINCLRKIDENDSDKDIKLREEIGHTPLEVWMGALLGILLSIFFSK